MMNKKNILRVGVFVCLVFFYVDTHAQNKESKNYATTPYWIQMMKDTTTNYFEAIKTFNTYWSGKEKPEAENEKFANAGKEDNKGKNVPYSFEYRKFQQWEMQVKPYVQDDGSILYPYQRLQLSRDSRRAKPLNNTK